MEAYKLAFFGLQLEPKDKEDLSLSDVYFKKVENRLASLPFYKSPFSRKKLLALQKDLYLIELEPSFPTIYPFGFLFIIIAFLFNVTFLYYVAGAFLLTYIFWSSQFYYFFAKMNLKKTGYKGNIKYVGKNKSSQLLVDHYILLVQFYGTIRNI